MTAAIPGRAVSLRPVWVGRLPMRPLAMRLVPPASLSAAVASVPAKSATGPAAADPSALPSSLAGASSATVAAAACAATALRRRNQRWQLRGRGLATAARGGDGAASEGAQRPMGYNKAVGGRLRIKQVVDVPDGGKSLIGSTVTICGWVRTVRSQKDLTFLKVNDGSTFKEMQVVVQSGATGYEGVATLGTGASVRIQGLVVESPASGQEVELACNSSEHTLQILGGVDSKLYPLAKKSHSIEFLRSIAHLRPRSNLIGAVTRVRNALALATHRFFQDRGFLYVHTPIITTADCEGAGEMFRVMRTDDVPATPAAAGAQDASNEFFGQPAFLTVSGQLAVENFCCSLGDVYTFGPTFRAENSSTTRHLAEFWMIEPEMAFADLSDDMDCAEDYIRFCAQTVLDTCASDLEFFALRVDKEVQDRLTLIASKPFKRLSYTEAVEELSKYVAEGKAKFEFEVAWGKELQTEHEKYLTDEVYHGPVIVYNYPKDCKAFYMRLNEDGKTVAAMDILCPGIGELVGGSQREERLAMLDERMDQLGLDKKDYWWYRDLRQYGSVPHAGFGVGFERLVMLCTGVQNIRDVIPFPRYPGHAEF